MRQTLKYPKLAVDAEQSTADWLSPRKSADRGLESLELPIRLFINPWGL